MLKKQTMYLETSVISAYFDPWNDAPAQKRHTRIFWKYAIRDYRVVISDIAINELKNFASARWQGKFSRLVQNFPVLKTDENVVSMAQEYLNQGVIPKTKKEDAFHIAVCAAHGIDFLISWNQKHIVRPYKMKQILELNAKKGIAGPVILNPLMFLEAVLY